MDKLVDNLVVPANPSPPLLLIAPILPGKAEAWRRLFQEVDGTRHREYEAARRRLGIRAEWVWISETPKGALGIVQIETAASAPALVTADEPFDRWFWQQMQALLAIKPTQGKGMASAELIFGWRDVAPEQGIVSNNSFQQGVTTMSEKLTVATNLTVATYASLLAMAHEWFMGTLQDVSADDLQWQPPGNALPIAAHVGHVIFAEDAFINGFLRERPALLESDFAGKTGMSEPQPLADDWSAWGRVVQIDLTVIRPYAQAVFADTAAWLAAIADDELAKPFDMTAFGLGMQTKSVLLAMLIGNVFAHCGEISCLKGLRGGRGYPF